MSHGQAKDCRSSGAVTFVFVRTSESGVPFLSLLPLLDLSRNAESFPRLAATLLRLRVNYYLQCQPQLSTVINDCMSSCSALAPGIHGCGSAPLLLHRTNTCRTRGTERTWEWLTSRTTTCSAVDGTSSLLYNIHLLESA